MGSDLYMASQNWQNTPTPDNCPFKVGSIFSGGLFNYGKYDSPTKQGTVSLDYTGRELYQTVTEKDVQIIDGKEYVHEYKRKVPLHLYEQSRNNNRYLLVDVKWKSSTGTWRWGLFFLGLNDTEYIVYRLTCNSDGRDWGYCFTNEKVLNQLVGVMDEQELGKYLYKYHVG